MTNIAIINKRPKSPYLLPGVIQDKRVKNFSLGNNAGNSANTINQELTQEEKLRLVKSRLEYYHNKETVARILKDQNIYSQFLGQSRVWHCGKTPTEVREFQKFVKGLKSGYYFQGMQHCGLGKVCKVCASKISNKRAEEIYHALMYYKSVQKRRLLMITYTIPHYISERLDKNIEALNSCFNSVMTSRSVREILGKTKTPYVKALEVTYGKNGFHPHNHTVYCIDQSVNIQELETEIRKIYLHFLQRFGKIGNDHAIKFDLWDEKIETLKDYLFKTTIHQELTRLQNKSAKKDSFTPFELIDLVNGVDLGKDVSFINDPEEVFLQYARQIKKFRIIQASQNFYKNAKVEEATDQEAVTDDQVDQEILQLQTKLYWHIVKNHNITEFVNSYILEGFQGITEYLFNLDIEVKINGREISTAEPDLLPWDLRKINIRIDRQGLKNKWSLYEKAIKSTEDQTR